MSKNNSKFWILGLVPINYESSLDYVRNVRWTNGALIQTKGCFNCLMLILYRFLALFFFSLGANISFLNNSTADAVGLQSKVRNYLSEWLVTGEGCSGTSGWFLAPGSCQSGQNLSVRQSQSEARSRDNNRIVLRRKFGGTNIFHLTITETPCASICYWQARVQVQSVKSKPKGKERIWTLVIYFCDV